ncbi:MAG: hypothetical protein DMD28_06090 [Gemmatimonadetes bacterium]|nr:MAG: hypothetical protein DMD28_06090 [Gemmatimonadota bacterium]
MRGFGAGVARWSLLLVAACSSQPNAPPAAFCPSNAPLQVLAMGKYAALQPVDGCVVFPANSSPDTAEYLLVPQATTGSPDLSTSFMLAGSAAAAAPALAVGAQVMPSPRSPAERFHDRLRELERTRAYGGSAGAPAPVPPTTPVPPRPSATITVGDRGRFKVLNTLTGLSLDTITAVARKVGQHIAIFIDTAAPQPGLSAFDLDTLRSVFDSVLYPTDTAAFGRESDIDGNGVVIVLLTNTVNKMVGNPCATYVAGFFFGGDVDPLYRRLFNNAEIFYAIVPDPLATLSCAHTVAQVKQLVPTTFAHEFQHMISYVQHVLVRGKEAEELWLNEGLSHYAEERGGRAFLPDTVAFCRYVRSDISNAVGYWGDLASHPLVDTSGIGGLAERGAGWLFVRYLADQYPQGAGLAGQDAFTRKLDNTSLTGATNVAAQTNDLFGTVVSRWALAQWVSDLPGFAAPAALTYTSWAFRTGFPRVSGRCGSSIAYPLVALAGAPASVSVSGTLRAGTGAVYQRVLQAPGGGAFQILFSDSSGAQLRETTAPRLNVIRIR